MTVLLGGVAVCCETRSVCDCFTRQYTIHVAVCCETGSVCDCFRALPALEGCLHSGDRP